MAQQVAVIAVGVAADELHHTLREQLGGAVLRCAWLTLAGRWSLVLGCERFGDALNVPALRRMTGHQQACIGGHEQLVESKTHTGASKQLRVNELGG